MPSKKYFFPTLAAAACCLHLSSAQANLVVTWSDDANMALTVPLGDKFYITGNAGSTTLVDNTPTDVGVLGFIYDLPDIGDDLTYSTTFTHSLTLNGISRSFTQTFTVQDLFFPEWSLSLGGSTYVDLMEGKILITMKGVATTFASFMQIPATLTFLPKSALVPEPGVPALLGGATLAVFARRRFSGLQATFR